MSTSHLDDALRLLGRFAVFTGVGVVAFIVSGMLFKPVFPDGLPPGPDRIVVVSSMATVALLVAHGAVVLFFERARWETTGLGAAGWHPVALLTGFATGAAGILVPTALLTIAGALVFEATVPGAQGQAMLDALMVLAAPAAFEELLTRGYVLGALARQYGEPAAVVLTSVAFGVMHLGNPGATASAVVAVVVAGIFLATLRLATGSLVAAWLAHLAINWIQGAVLHAPISGLGFLPKPGYRAVPVGADWLTGGAWGLEAGAVTAGTLLVVTFLLILARPRPRPHPRAT